MEALIWSIMSIILKRKKGDRSGNGIGEPSIFDRLTKIYEEILPTDREHRELGKKSAEILHQLFAILPEEHRQLLDEYDAGRALQMNRQDELIYGLGLVDGNLLSTWVDQTRQDPKKSLAEFGFFSREEDEEDGE